MPIVELFYQCYFRATTSGWEHMPSTGSVLVVGSHNGGALAPDMYMFIYDWLRRFGTERLAYGLMHKVVLNSPPALLSAARFGAIPAKPEMALAALRRGAAVLVYPGGAEDAYRPFSQRHQIELAGRKGFIKVALRENVPIVPVVSVGAHETLCILANFHPIFAQLDRMGLWDYRPILGNVFPIYLGLPWGIGFGFLPHLPLPIQIHTRVCEPIVFERSGREAAADRKYVDLCYETVRERMQKCLDDLVAQKKG